MVFLPTLAIEPARPSREAPPPGDARAQNTTSDGDRFADRFAARDEENRAPREAHSRSAAAREGDRAPSPRLFIDVESADAALAELGFTQESVAVALDPLLAPDTAEPGPDSAEADGAETEFLTALAAVGVASDYDPSRETAPDAAPSLAVDTDKPALVGPATDELALVGPTTEEPAPVGPAIDVRALVAPVAAADAADGATLAAARALASRQAPLEASPAAAEETVSVAGIDRLNTDDAAGLAQIDAPTRKTVSDAIAVRAGAADALVSPAPSLDVTSVRAAKLEALAPAPPQTPPAPDPAQQVIAAIRADRAGADIDVRLDPPELGRVRIHFAIERNDAVVATVSSERSDTLDLLRRHGGDLLRELARAGIENVRLEFAASGEQKPFEREASRPDARFAEFDDAQDDRQAIYVRRRNDARLDRFV